MIYQTPVFELDANVAGNIQWKTSGEFAGSLVTFPVCAPSLLVLTGVSTLTPVANGTTRYLFRCTFTCQDSGLSFVINPVQGGKYRLPVRPDGTPFRWSYLLQINPDSAWYAANGHDVGGAAPVAAIQLMAAYVDVDLPDDDDAGSIYVLLDDVSGAVAFVPVPWYCNEVVVSCDTGPVTVMMEDWNAGRSVLGNIATLQTGGYWQSKIRGGVIGVDPAAGQAKVWGRVKA